MAQTGRPRIAESKRLARRFKSETGWRHSRLRGQIESRQEGTIELVEPELFLVFRLVGRIAAAATAPGTNNGKAPVTSIGGYRTAKALKPSDDAVEVLVADEAHLELFEPEVVFEKLFSETFSPLFHETN